MSGTAVSIILMIDRFILISHYYCINAHIPVGVNEYAYLIDGRNEMISCSPMNMTLVLRSIYIEPPFFTHAISI